LQAGDDEHNPFAQWENIERKQEAEMEQKAVKRQTARQAQFVSVPHHSVHVLTM
jgi:pre-mRNA-splicing factor ATP-dependent RNA helicase DHX38/PRP16